MLTRIKPLAMKLHDFMSVGVKQSVYAWVHIKLLAFKAMK